MKDIARDLGVSVITISKVLRNHPDVGDETRERVLARVKELDYQPNLAARSLVTGRTYLVGLVAALIAGAIAVFSSDLVATKHTDEHRPDHVSLAAAIACCSSS